MHHSLIYFFSADLEKAFADIMGTEPIYLEACRLMKVVLVCLRLQRKM